MSRPPSAAPSIMLSLGSRPPSRGVRPLSSAQSPAARPPSAMQVAGLSGASSSSRTGSRMGVVYGGSPGSGGAISHVSPVSQHGVPPSSHGMVPGTSSGARKATDHSGYVRDLKAKTAELMAEIANMQSDLDIADQAQRESMALEQELIAAREEKGSLETQLLAVNYLSDKLRTTSDVTPAMLLKESGMLEQENNARRPKLDALFAEREMKEKEVADLQNRITELQEKFVAELQQMGDEKQKAYNSMKEENDRLINEIKQFQSILEDERLQCNQLESNVQGDSHKVQALGMQEELGKLRRQLEDLQEEEFNAQHSIPEEKNRLIQAIKLLGNDKIALQTAFDRVEQETSTMRDQMEKMERHMEDTKENTEMRLKIAELQKRHDENLLTLEQANRTQQDITETNTKLQLMILCLLEHISKQYVTAGTVPGTEKQRELQEELNVKVTLVDQENSTHETLDAVLAQKQQQVQKIESLEQSITTETTSVVERIAQLKREMDTFAEAEALSQEAAQASEQVSSENLWMSSQRDILVQENQQLAAELASQERQTRAMDTHQQLTVQERKMTEQEQNLFAMQDYISSALDTKPLASEVITMADDLNKRCCQTQTMSFL
ncbi:intraflagellar transport protein 74-like [Pelomyxa schiedti]|nr:intraflagellar transport protein 74-like [Pelomyxa schiedti]